MGSILRNTPGEKGQQSGPRGGVLELTEAIAEDGSVRRLSSSSEPGRTVPGEAAKPEAGRVEPQPPRPQGEGAVAPAARKEEAAEGSEAIVSATAAGAAAASLAGLATLGRERRREGETPLGTAGKTLEDLVRDLLRPLLQTWLDNNLPDLVERLVREEIARVVREAGLR
jgi:cell pole-organizing protein PopZ